MSSTEIRDPDGDTVRFSHDERGVWVDVEEHVAGAPARTVAAGPFKARDLRAAVDGDYVDPWIKVGLGVLVIPPAAGVVGYGPWLETLIVAFTLWLLAYVWRAS